MLFVNIDSNPQPTRQGTLRMGSLCLRSPRDCVETPPEVPAAEHQGHLNWGAPALPPGAAFSRTIHDTPARAGRTCHDAHTSEISAEHAHAVVGGAGE